MIEVAGIQVSRASMIDLAHRLVLVGETSTASRILDGLAHHDRITLEISDGEAILAELLVDPPAGLEALRAALFAEQAERRLEHRPTGALAELRAGFDPAPSG